MKNKAQIHFLLLLTGLLTTQTLTGQNVGIGTTTPTEKLDVFGNIVATNGGNITAGGTLSAATIDFSGTENGNIETNGNIDLLGTLTAGTIDFNSSFEVGQISTTGAIHTTSTLSGATISFAGTETGDLFLNGGVLSATQISFTGTEVGDLALGGTLSAVTIDFGGAETGNIITAGDITAANLTATNSCTCPSDARFKQNIVPLPQALDKVLALRGVGYEFNCAAFPERGFSQSPQVGFIAQELQAVMPELVRTMEDGYLAVDYQKLTPVLVEAIKEQQATIVAQQQTIADMRARLVQVEKLAASMSQLEARLQQLETANVTVVEK
ncbi:MAG: tail fiber domain-containing protein [Bacteroidetes bacterium]|nr:tail fiber domain-containing protein [Bacteroidota bacterium]